MSLTLINMRVMTLIMLLVRKINIVIIYYVFDMSSSTVEAQKLANKTNLQIAQETNQANRDIATQANEWNWHNLEAQNNWNIEQWNRENEYNSPKQQVQRYLEAGINPLWAIGNGDPGSAQHLESGQPQPAEVAHMEAARVSPEFDPYLSQHVANINASARDLVNGVQGFAQLGLQERDVNTREAVGATQAALNRASAVEKKASAVGKELENQWNLTTFAVRAKAESQKLYNMEEQLSNLKADTAEHESKKAEIDAHKELIREQTNSVIAQIKQRNRQLDILQQHVNVQRAGVDVQRAGVEVQSKQQQLADQRFQAEIKHWNNQDLLQYMYRFGRELEGSMKGQVGLEGLGVSAGAKVKELTPATMKQAIECGLEFCGRYANNPTPKMADDIGSVQETLQKIQDWRARQLSDPVTSSGFNTDTWNIQNPSDSWNQ